MFIPLTEMRQRTYRVHNKKGRGRRLGLLTKLQKQQQAKEKKMQRTNPKEEE